MKKLKSKDRRDKRGKKTDEKKRWRGQEITGIWLTACYKWTDASHSVFWHYYTQIAQSA